MAKAYLVIQVDTFNPNPTVVRAVISDRPAGELPGESSERFWATVDECEAETRLDARQGVRERLNRAALRLPSFAALKRLVDTGDTWEPELSDSLGG